MRYCKLILFLLCVPFFTQKLQAQSSYIDSFNIDTKSHQFQIVGDTAYYLTTDSDSWSVVNEVVVFSLQHDSIIKRITVNGIQNPNINIVDDLMYLSNDSKVDCYEINEPTLVWTYRVENNVLSKNGIYFKDQYLFAGVENKVYVLNKNTGKVIYEKKALPIHDYGGSVFIENDILYFTKFNSGQITAVNLKSGKKMWSASDNIQVISDDALLYGKDSLLIPKHGHVVKCYNAKTGKVNWENDLYDFSLSKAAIYGCGSTLGGDYVYSHGKLYTSNYPLGFFILNADDGSLNKLVELKLGSPTDVFEYNGLIWLVMGDMVYALNPVNDELVISHQLPTDNFYTNGEELINGNLYLSNNIFKNQPTTLFRINIEAIYQEYQKAIQG